jgi:hypothetical protein
VIGENNRFARISKEKIQAEGVKKTETDLQRMMQRSEPNMCRDGRER